MTQLTQTEIAKPINLGEYGWQISNSYYPFETEERAREVAAAENIPAENIKFVDTRISCQDLIQILNTAEGEVWDEYFSWQYRWNDGPMTSTRKLEEMPYDRLWKHTSWIAVYVVTGGSEGLYLHVDAIEGNKRDNVMLAKTLHCDKWDECWASAGRVAQMLGS
jgi:hypothetical protein